MAPGPAANADGQVILFRRDEPGDQGETRPYPLTPFSDRVIDDFAFSADGTRLAVSRSVTSNDIVLFKGFT